MSEREATKEKHAAQAAIRAWHTTGEIVKATTRVQRRSRKDATLKGGRREDASVDTAATLPLEPSVLAQLVGDVDGDGIMDADLDGSP